MDSGKSKSNFHVDVEFYGAVNGMVTGSGTLVTVTRGSIQKKILIDFGIFQGEQEHLNVERCFVPKDIDYVLLTHAHLDHCGCVPVLYKETKNSRSYKGKIYGSEETLIQATHILKDSAILNRMRATHKYIETHEIEQSVKRGTSKWSKNPPSLKEISAVDSLRDILSDNEAEILYLPEDVEEAVRHFVSVPIGKEFSLCEGIDVKFIPNSHINGATMIEIYASYGAERYGIAFTGDIGKRKTPLYREIAYYKEPDINAIVLESLHGCEAPDKTYIDSMNALKKILKKCIKENKNLYIPVFAMDRSAILLMLLNTFMDSGMNFNCFFDTPLGERELLCYMRAYNSNASKWFDYKKKYPFNTDRITFATDYKGHMEIVKKSGPNVVITSSCMGYGGRVIDYFDHHIEDENAVFVFPGYLPPRSPSKILCEAPMGEIIEDEEVVMLKGRRYVKHCEAYQLTGFSSHGYIEDKMAIVNRYCNANVIFLNHGDQESIDQLAEYLYTKTTAEIIIPTSSEVYKLN